MSTTVWTNRLEPSSVADKARNSSRVMVSGSRHRPVGIGSHFDGPLIFFWDFGCHLVTPVVLEPYLRTKEDAGPLWRFAGAVGLFVLTVLMSVGIWGFTTLTWRFLAGL
jgi:hypothetical protein